MSRGGPWPHGGLAAAVVAAVAVVSDPAPRVEEAFSFADTICNILQLPSNTAPCSMMSDGV